MTQQVQQLGGAGAVLAFAWAAVQSVRKGGSLPVGQGKSQRGENPGRWWQALKGVGGKRDEGWAG